MVELIVVLILAGIMAAIAVPRLTGNGENAAQVFGDQIVSGMRLAHKTALSHRRLVCATLAARALTLRIASANPASSCANTLANAPDSEFSTSNTDIAATPAATAYFQPNGDITVDAAGTQPATGSVAITLRGATVRTFQVEGNTGYVE